jgi:hypothetical protein
VQSSDYSVWSRPKGSQKASHRQGNAEEIQHRGTPSLCSVRRNNLLPVTNTPSQTQSQVEVLRRQNCSALMPSGGRHAAWATVSSTGRPVAATLLRRWWVLLSTVATLVATRMSAAVLVTISMLCALTILQHVPGCAGGCRSLLGRRGNLALDRHSLLAVRIRRVVLRHSCAHSVHRSQPASRSHLDAVARDAVVAILRVDHSRLGPGVAAHHRRTVQAEVKSSCCGPAVVRAGQADLLVGTTRAVRFRYKCHWTGRMSRGCIRSHQRACCAIRCQFTDSLACSCRMCSPRSHPP